MQCSHWAIPEKRLKIFHSEENKVSHLKILQNCATPLGNSNHPIQGQKTRPMEIPLDSFLNTPLEIPLLF